MEVGGCQYGYFCGFPRTRRKHDSIWVITDRMTKSTCFFLIKALYSAEEYDMLYIKDKVRMHGVPLSIKLKRVLNSLFIFERLSKMDLVPR